MDARPGPLGTPLAQFGLGALVLVAAGALLFSLIGAVSDADEGDGGASPTAAATEGGTTTPATDGPSTETPSGATESTDAPDGTPTDQPTTDQPTTDTPTEAPPAIDPATITIQVLSGSDDSADQDAVVACLGDGGYDDLITNRAITTYSATIVYFTPGEDNQAKAQQVADRLGVAGVEEKPSNLSNSVPVHVVTGQDGTDLC